ncbi:hypothetical protein N7541_003284 [Penicillium brevicompactum]|uniref:DNA2/NAM7 helicase-like C-terminal domain-containing protein n=1 Tax=Penicillium brevicompactum TaxID=5074 RepID=A0A9W9V0X4_PENBR|nr:hypothetical protein N7541_003284 [Penicillium brevicompactum]
MSDRYQCLPGSSFFVSANRSSVLRRKGGSPVLNPHYESHIDNLIAALRERVPSLAPKGILVLSYYNKERRVLSDLLRKLGHSEVSVRSVDCSQGSESPVAILPTTRPGGEYDPGFLTDR